MGACHCRVSEVSRFGPGAVYAELDAMTIDEKRDILQQARKLLAELGNNQPSGDTHTVVSEMIRRLRELETAL